MTRKMYCVLCLVSFCSCLGMSARPTAPAVIRAGEALFRQKCTGCHAVNGEGGTFCPDLTHVGSRRDRDYIETKLRHPTRTNPASVMPTFGDLPPEQFASLVSYLEQLK